MMKFQGFKSNLQGAEMQKIFMSHISEEAPLASVLKKWIDTTFTGHSETFMSSDIESMPAGTEWLREIDQALAGSSIFIVLCSPVALKRPWVSFETGCGWIKQVPVVPVCHSGIQASSLPLPISRFQALEIESEEFISDFLKSIAKHLNVSNVPKIDQVSLRGEIEKSIEEISYDEDAGANGENRLTAPIPDVRVEVSPIICAPPHSGIVSALSIKIANHSPGDIYYQQIHLEFGDDMRFTPFKDFIRGNQLLPTVIHPGDAETITVDPQGIQKEIEDINSIKRTVVTDKIGREYYASKEKTVAAVRHAIDSIKK